KALAGKDADTLWDEVHARVKETADPSVDLALGFPGATAATLRQRARVFALEDRIELFYPLRWVFPGTLSLFLDERNDAPRARQARTAQPLSVVRARLEPVGSLPAHQAMMLGDNLPGFVPRVKDLLAATRPSGGSREPAPRG